MPGIDDSRKVIAQKKRKTGSGMKGLSSVLKLSANTVGFRSDYCARNGSVEEGNGFYGGAGQKWVGPTKRVIRRHLIAELVDSSG